MANALLVAGPLPRARRAIADALCVSVAAAAAGGGGGVGGAVDGDEAVRGVLALRTRYYDADVQVVDAGDAQLAAADSSDAALAALARAAAALVLVYDADDHEVSFAAAQKTVQRLRSALACEPQVCVCVGVFSAPANGDYGEDDEDEDEDALYDERVPENVLAWCIEHEFEHVPLVLAGASVEPSTPALARVREALESHVWSEHSAPSTGPKVASAESGDGDGNGVATAVRAAAVAATAAAAAAAASDGGDDDDDDDDAPARESDSVNEDEDGDGDAAAPLADMSPDEFDKLMATMLQMKARATQLTGDRKRENARDAARMFWNALVGSGGDEDGLTFDKFISDIDAELASVSAASSSSASASASAPAPAPADARAAQQPQQAGPAGRRGKSRKGGKR